MMNFNYALIYSPLRVQANGLNVSFCSNKCLAIIGVLFQNRYSAKNVGHLHVLIMKGEGTDKRKSTKRAAANCILQFGVVFS
jgi:hypothetical protein